MPERNRREPELAAALDRHWDALFAGDIPSTDDRAHALEDLDPGLAATAQRVHALDIAPRPHPAFASALWEDLMQSQALSLASNAGMTPPIPLGMDAIPDRIRSFTPPRMMSRIAAAILLVALLAGSAFAALYPLRQRDGAGLPLFAPVGTPAAPDATAQAMGTFEFLWESDGGPEPIDRPYGIGVDPQGNIWVADSMNDRFQIIAPDGSFLETWGESGSGEGQFDFDVKHGVLAADLGDVAFDAAGNIYVADTGNFRVQKFAPDRSFLLAWGGEGKEAGQFMVPGGITVAADGTVYVTDEGRGDVQKFSADGALLDTIGEFGFAEGQFVMPAGIAVDADGHVWIADNGKDQIQRFDSASEFVAPLGTEDELNATPNDVAVDPLGRVYVADPGNDRVQVFTPDGQKLAQISGSGAHPGQFTYPNVIALGEDGVVYVGDEVRIQAFRLTLPEGDVPAPAVTAQVATPAAGDTAMVGGFEFLWESEGGPDPMIGPNGVGVDPQGNVWVADSNNDRFQIFAPDKTFLENWGESGAGEGQLDFEVKHLYLGSNLGDVAFDAEGNFYVADTGNFRVQKFAPDRSFLLAWGEEGEDAGQFLAPGSIAVAPDGTVYVLDGPRGDVQRFSADGAPLGVIGEPGSAEGQFLNPAGIAVNADGQVFVADFDNNRIQQFSPDGEFLAAWGSLGNGEGEFHYPNDVAVDEQGRIYVIDTGNNRVQILAPDGRFLAEVGNLGTQPGQFIYPVSIAVDIDGTIYVSDRDRIQAFRLTAPEGSATDSGDTALPATPVESAAAQAGTFEFLWESAGGPDPMIFPYGMSIDPQGNVWVADGKTNRFEILAPDGTFLESWGDSGAGEGQFDFAVRHGYLGDTYGDVAFDADGNFYVADTGNFRVQKFASDRSFLLAWGGEGEDDGQFLAPGSIAVAADGTVYVVDRQRADIQRFGGDGALLDVIGEPGSGEGQFKNPAGMAIDGDGHMWVADLDNNRIQQVSADGGSLAAWGAMGAGDGAFHYPADVVVDQLGRVYVADTANNRVQVLSPDGRVLAEIGGVGKQPGQFVFPHGIVIDEAGVIYVSDHNRVQAFRLIAPQGDVLAS